jgi:hypothetical protein
MLCNKRVTDDEAMVAHLFAAHTEEEALFAMSAMQG